MDHVVNFVSAMSDELVRRLTDADVCGEVIKRKKQFLILKFYFKKYMNFSDNHFEIKTTRSG